MTRSAFVECFGGSLLLGCALALCGVGCEEESAVAETDAQGSDSEESSATDAPSDTASETVGSDTETALDQETWVDEAHGLQWQNPSRQETSLYPGAKAFCDGLELAGKDDWRLPTLNEARTLLEGVSSTMEGGFCAASEECFNWMNCSASPKYEDACEGCNDVSRKHLTEEDCTRDIEAGECYWRVGLEGACESYWTTTKTGVPTGRYSISYASGLIQAGLESSSGKSARCVRTM